MILREITVKGVKCFRDEVTVGRFGDGLNMIFGPNETGKSTLIEATARALFDGYSITGDAAESLRPWNTSLTPEIGLEFEAHDRQWRLEKRLLSGASCSLSCRDGSGWSLMHARDGADDFLRELLRGAAPGRGASDLRHWGLARTLWCLSDPCMLGRADSSTCVVPGAVAAQLRAVLGEGSADTLLEPILDRLGERYEEHFTAKRGDPRANSRIVNLTAEIDELTEQLAQARASLQEVEDAAARLEALSGEFDDLARERERLQEQIATYRDEAEKIGTLLTEIEMLKKELDQRRSECNAEAADLAAFLKAASACDEARDALSKVTVELEGIEADLRAAQQLVSEAEEAHESAQGERKRAAREQEQARKLIQALALLEERDSLVELLASVEGLRGRCEDLSGRLQAMPCPDDSEVERAEELERDVQRLQAQLEAAGLSVTIRTRRQQEVAISGGDEELHRTAEAGDEVAYTAGASLEIDLPEVAHVTVKSGAAEPAQLQAHLVAAREQLGELLAPYAAEGSAALRDLQRDHERVADDLARAEEQVLAAAAPFDGPEQVRDRQAEIRVELTKRLNELQLSEEALAKLDRPDLDAREEAFRAAQALEDQAQETLTRRRDRASGLTEQRDLMRANATEFENALRENGPRMEAILQRYECADEEALQARVGEAKSALASLEETLDAMREKLPSEEADPRRLMQTAEEALKGVGAREIELAGKRGDNEGIIERARTEGRYERLTKIEEDLAARQRELHAAWREGQALKLLRRIVESRRSEAGGALPGLEEQVAVMFRQVTGRDRPLHMDEQMNISGVVDGGIEHPPTALSSGTREQLDLVTRLALGETWAEHYGRTMVVLDDALLYTDPRRHDRIKQLLQRAGEMLQIFIMTSHPDRYRGIVPGDCCFDLEAIRARA